MNIAEFCQKYKVSKRETEIATAVYKTADKTESDWCAELSSKITFKEVEVAPTKLEVAKAKIDKVVEAAKKKDEPKDEEKTK